MSAQPRAADVIGDWPEESREAAQLVVEKYGEPHEATVSQLIWNAVGPWKRIIAQRAHWEHRFPAPHTVGRDVHRLPRALRDAHAIGAVRRQRDGGAHDRRGLRVLP